MVVWSVLLKIPLSLATFNISESFWFKLLGKGSIYFQWRPFICFKNCYRNSSSMPSKSCELLSEETSLSSKWFLWLGDSLFEAFSDYYSYYFLADVLASPKALSLIYLACASVNITFLECLSLYILSTMLSSSSQATTYLFLVCLCARFDSTNC